MATPNILTLIDEIKTAILALNPPVYFDELGADKIDFRLPTGRQVGDLSRAPTTLAPDKSTRTFIVKSAKGSAHGRFDGYEAPKFGVVEVHIRYYIPPKNFDAEDHVERMSSRDAEVISHAITTREWINSFIGPASFITSNDLEPTQIAGLYLLRLFFNTDYHYDGQ